jgi:hypothetical protein
MRVRIPFLALSLLGIFPAAFGQHLSFGIVGGASLTEDFQDRSTGGTPAIIAYSTPKRWIAGATVQVSLPLRLAIEVDGLYHELEFTNATVWADGTLHSVSPAPVVTWEAPALVKYRFPLETLKPFVEAGAAFRVSGNLNGTSPSSDGFIAGMGVEARIWKLRLAPQIRYLRWARDQNRSYYQPSTVPDQVECLMGISF